ncbi:hypothetical protein BZG36_03262 [Bifiguratus adelaidae]|uniref:FAD dependent oxidoreductase domain-containing protein n=1 Tax=Bifiguratus adelaidae TaxID=1938954 RepID=A0A261XXE0_9FUNG|nr:hypothetical protein BZG36_03262 [Bifiguratus adelaidae]
MSEKQRKSRVLIVGGGCFGLSMAYALAKRGIYNVIVFDRKDIPVVDAASTDITKIVRMDYGSETEYMTLALESLPGWRELDRASRKEFGESCFHETGVLFFGRHGQFGSFERDSIQAFRNLGYSDKIELFETGQSIVARFPQFESAVSHGFNIAYFNKLGGWCDSTLAIKTMHLLCREAGIQFVTGLHGCLSQLLFSDSSHSKVIGIKTSDGKEHFADKVILATGAWTLGVIDTDDMLVATAQTVVHVMPTKQQAFTGTTNFLSGYYGFPSIPSDGRIKIAKHSRGYLNPVDSATLPIRTSLAETATQSLFVSIPRTRVTHPDDTMPEDALADVQKFLGDFMPEFKEMPIIEMRVCWYCDSVDGKFLVSEHPRHQNLSVVSGDSGHGIKFLPIIGEAIVDIIESRDPVRAGVSLKELWAWKRKGSVEEVDGQESRHSETSESARGKNRSHKISAIRAGWTSERPVLEQGHGKMVPLEVLTKARAQANV